MVVDWILRSSTRSFSLCEPYFALIRQIDHKLTQDTHCTVKTSWDHFLTTADAFTHKPMDKGSRKAIEDSVKDEKD